MEEEAEEARIAAEAERGQAQILLARFTRGALAREVVHYVRAAMTAEVTDCTDYFYAYN